MNFAKFLRTPFYLKAVNYFRKKASPQMFSWVLNTPLNYFQGLKLSYKTQPIQVTLKDYLSVLMPM